MAHELVHAGSAKSVRPRLFGDPIEDREERRARNVASIASAAVQAAQQPASIPARLGALVSQNLPEGADGGEVPTIHRQVEPAADESQGAPEAIPAEQEGAPTRAEDDEDLDEDTAPEPDRHEQLAELIERLESHLMDELDRRGGRYEGMF